MVCRLEFALVVCRLEFALVVCRLEFALVVCKQGLFWLGLVLELCKQKAQLVD